VNARLAGFHAAMQSQQWGDAVALVEFAEPGDPEAIRELIARCRPDAIVCANDATAARLMTTLYALGTRVPAQVKITGIDGMKYASMLQVPLTTIHQPCAELGATALMAMLDRVSHPNTPGREFLVDFRLVIRASTHVAGPQE
jgi:DNA-binding LacI/PurR family transcriptional regulator